MDFLNVFIFFLLSVFAYGKDIHLTPCSKNDLSCFQATCRKFMHAFANGFGEPYNTEPIDPLSLSERSLPTCCEDPPIGSVSYKNIVVKGLKDVTFTSFVINEEEGKLYLNLTNSLEFNSDVTFKYYDKTFNGTMKFKDAQVKVYSVMDIGFSPDNKGVNHLALGPEQNICEVVKVPTIVLNSELENAMNNDPVVGARRKKYRAQIEEHKNKLACVVVEWAYPHVFELWRIADRYIAAKDILLETLKTFEN